MLVKPNLANLGILLLLLLLKVAVRHRCRVASHHFTPLFASNSGNVF